jgi:mono/diheme cytochrome c family protein
MDAGNLRKRGMKLTAPFLLIALLFFAPLAQSEPLSPILQLRKIKLRLTGVDPSFQEYQTAKTDLDSCPDSACVDGYLKNRIAEYMNSPQFVGRGVEFVNSLLYLNPLPKPYEDVKTTPDSLTLLVERVFRENRPWNELFLGNEYEIATAAPSLRLDDVNYFAHFIPEALKPLREGLRFLIQVPGPDLAAGILTTSRWNLRFFNTPVNEGRKRAAAILRIGFCDEMFPAIERGEEHKKVEDEIARGRRFEEMIGGLSNAELHGQKRDCAQCHVYRSLDHLAWTFRTSELGLGRRPAAGRFTYLMPGGQVVDQPVRGLGHYARVLTEQEPFAPCQVQNLWNEYAGDSKTLNANAELKRRLVAEYMRPNKGVKDFIAHMIMQPEFRAKAVERETDAKFAAAEKVLVHCNSCHASRRPSFTKLPIMVNGLDKTQHWIQRIIERMALEPYAQEQLIADMPPEESPWQPNREDVKAVLEWIEAGAPDAEGKTHISLEWLESLKGQP